jgi:hypothetical protein
VLDPEGPSERFANMYEVVQGLSALEEEGRALAKSVYFYPDTQLVFFEQFYENFFRVSPESKEKFRSVDRAEQKLMMAMAAVRDEFKNFHKSFLTTMNNFVPDQETREQWDNRFMAVTDYMISECVGATGEKKKRVGAVDSANAHRPPGGKTGVETKTPRKKKSKSELIRRAP